MGSLSVQKGKRAERSVALLLNEMLTRLCTKHQIEPLKLARNLKQTQCGGFDLDGLDWIAIEIKHHKVVALDSWWIQCCGQATSDREPVLIWKQHGGKWRVRMFGRLELTPLRKLRVPVDISWDSFAAWFERRAEIEIEKAAGEVIGLFT